MLFNSALFLVVFLPVFLVMYHIAPIHGRNHVALGFSLLFYAWGAPKFAVLLLSSGVADYIVTHAMAKGQNRKLWLAVGVSINLIVLGFFKYFNFFIENVQSIFENFGFQFSVAMNVALPLGISFFTFQKVSYIIDVYRGDSKPAQSITNYLLFVFLFPQLIAGPIVRYKDLEKQIINRSGLEADYNYKIAGIFRFIIGLVKKVLIADALAPLADAAFATQQLDWPSAAFGLLVFSFQIYYDFSAYSDMAIGLGMLMGFSFPENFNWPYQAKGFRDFWKRWHITLSEWLKDYLYLPLGGSRSGKFRAVLNLWIVFLVSGLWHGASWNFIIWGAWHGTFITLEHYNKWFERLPNLLSTLLTFLFVTLGWVWFRAEDLTSAVHYFQALFLFNHGHTLDVSLDGFTALCFAAIFAFIPPMWHLNRIAQKQSNYLLLTAKLILALLALLVCLGQIANQSAQPFIYFRF